MKLATKKIAERAKIFLSHSSQNLGILTSNLSRNMMVGKKEIRRERKINSGNFHFQVLPNVLIKKCLRFCMVYFSLVEYSGCRLTLAYNGPGVCEVMDE